MARKLPVDLVTRLLEDGLGPRAIVDHLREHVGIEVSPQAISTFRKRHTDVPAQHSTRRVIPWDVRPEHRSNGYRRAILAFHRRAQGRTLTGEERRNLDHVERTLRESGQVITYQQDEGWTLVPARPGIDTGIIREPEAAMTEQAVHGTPLHPTTPQHLGGAAAAAAGVAAGAGAAQASGSGEGTRLDPWFGAYAQRAHGMRASEIRALFSVANRPEVVSLAGGMPFIQGLPLDVIGEAMQRLITTKGATALQYGSGQGDVELRERILEVCALEGITDAHPDDVVVTTGSQQALDLVTRIFVDPGDVILAEAPSYVGALGVFRSYEAQVEHVPMDAFGLIPEALERALLDARTAGKRVKFLYTIPNYHNPAGVTLTLERRHQVLEVCQRFGVLIVEDNPYGLLGFDREPLPAMRAFDDEGVLYLGSFSKTFAPGYRVGWVIAPHAVREKLVLASESSILSPSNASQMAITTYLDTCDWKGQIKSYRELYRERRDAMIGALSEHLPSATWNVPDGGFYVWVRLPEGLDARSMLPRAVTERVAYVPGTAFFYDGQGSDHMRLSFCYPTPERIREGVRRLASVVNAEADLVQLFGTRAELDDDPRDAEHPAPNLA
ncbi:putative transcriptional regulator, GntR family [Xylanimonas cellulosilytica DSM 15894]|uniref:Transcriptional regulator, GntR family n=2 Tax=Xylanimonas TaxID=186188 RepID=D1BRV3_XYLCX|nr:putative transcriptional regulator, GntR family [Xylanimonas cellulosilytica DSM 15894]